MFSFFLRCWCIGRFESWCLLSVGRCVPESHVCLWRETVASVCCFARCCFHFLMYLSAAISRFSQFRQYSSERNFQESFIESRSATSSVVCILCGISIVLCVVCCFRHCQTAAPSAEDAGCLTTSMPFLYVQALSTWLFHIAHFAPGRPCGCVPHPLAFHLRGTMQSIVHSIAGMLSGVVRMILERIRLRRILLFA